MFENGSCSKGTQRGPLSLARDLRGGIDGLLVGHEVRLVLVDAVVKASCGTCRWGRGWQPPLV